MTMESVAVDRKDIKFLVVRRMMNLLDNPYYKLNRKLFSFIGLWPYQNPKNRRVRTIIMNVIMLIAIIAQISNVFTSKFDVELLLTSSMFFLPNLCIVVVYYTAYFNTKKIKYFLDRIVIDWNELKPEELKIVEKYAAESKLLTWILIYTYYVPVAMMFVFSLMPYILDDFVSPGKSHAHKFFYPIELFIDKEKHPYVNLFIINLFIVFIGIISLANYTLYLVYVQHACAIFSVIGYMLEHAMTETQQKDLSCSIESNEMYLKIIRSVKYHKRAIEYIEIINSFSEFCYLVQMIMSLIILVVDVMGLLRMSGSRRSITTTITYAMHIAGITCWLFFNCIIGQKVVDHSIIVFKKTCTIPWHLFPPRIQKLAIILLMRSAKPCYLSIGKMFVSSHEFFVTILQTSISYGMVLHSL